VSVGDHDVVAVAGQAVGDRRADAGAGTGGDQSDWAIRHGLILVRVDSSVDGG
jgi:hypothetical protein